VSCLVGEKRHDSQGRDEKTIRGVRQTCKAFVSGETDTAPANSRTRDALCPSDILRGEAGEALAL
jgi:hypothetical protein